MASLIAEGHFFYFRKCPFEYDFVEHKSPIVNIALQFIFLQTIFSSDLTRISEQKTKVVPWWCVVGLGLTSWLYWHLRWKLKCSNLDRSCPTSHKQYRTWNQDVSQCNNIFIAASSLSGCFDPCGLVIGSCLKFSFKNVTWWPHLVREEGLTKKSGRKELCLQITFFCSGCCAWTKCLCNEISKGSEITKAEKYNQLNCLQGKVWQRKRSCNRCGGLGFWSS